MIYALIALTTLAAALLIEPLDTRRRLSLAQTDYYAAAHDAQHQRREAVYWQARAIQAERKRVWSLNEMMRGET